ncbi:hypothetical protein DFQ01_10676 [Paenibacillus cellulosilyticus]|uniref:Uncharacterized protein n=1 Tax=Paenibacillus cellulosilyticus TaxID=375489 RepID=A0A2V2Z3J0_9BACL|nr:hypothetical protein [Paenibacillus cellulosilyticus]PWW04793.1 hypothetical protein DFQ01_10676 [Paenibacillus cellulosilyticus]QKS45914.1 hypothetical protein HUB94_16780 [Paenibacillus cellulosilyticus]
MLRRMLWTLVVSILVVTGCSNQTTTNVVSSSVGEKSVNEEKSPVAVKAEGGYD